jgi:alpha-tubulin suppressor-like RCC1 family protein
MPTSAEQIATATAQLTIDSGKLHDIIHGAANATVPTDGGPVPTIANILQSIAAQIVAGYNAGYVVIVDNDAARALAVPAQLTQLLIQRDTKSIYYANGLAAGNWTIHPFQAAADNVAAALAAVNDAIDAMGDRMAAEDYVGNAAVGVVRTAERLKVLVDFIAASPNSAVNFLGVENGAMQVFPLLTQNRAVDIIDGKARHTQLANTSRRAQGIGVNFAFVNTPRRLVSWGAQGAIGAGILGSGMTGTQSFHVRPVLARQQPDRNLPDFDQNSIYTTNGNITKIASQNSSTTCLTADGLVLVSGMAGQGVKALFGSGVDKTQLVLMPIYFNDGGANKPIRLFDVQDSTTVKAATGIYVDTSEGVWLLTSNPNAAGYGNGLVGAQNIPVKLNAGYPAWNGKIVKKVRCDVTGNVYILFTDGNLYAGGGSNTTGQLNTGGTGKLLNPAQIANGVDDFEVAGQEYDTVLTLFVLQGTTLKGCGFNAAGQLGQTTGTVAQNKANKLSFVTIAENVDLVRIGGTDNTTVIYRKTDGTWFGVGLNTEGCFGQGASAVVNYIAVQLTNLQDLIANNGGFVNLVISGYNSKHSSCVVCSNGKAFACGNNTDGCLANGTLVATNAWNEVLWSPRDGAEKIVDVSSAVGPSGGPAFTWLTNHGRLLMAGSSSYGFVTGLQPAVAYNVLVASPVQLGTV